MVRFIQGTTADVCFISFIVFTVASLWYGDILYSKSMHILRDEKYYIPFGLAITAIIFAVIRKALDILSYVSASCKKVMSSLIGLVILPLLSFLFSTGYLIVFFLVTDVTDIAGINFGDIWFVLVLIANISSVVALVTSSLQYLEMVKGCLKV